MAKHIPLGALKYQIFISCNRTNSMEKEICCIPLQCYLSTKVPIYVKHPFQECNVYTILVTFHFVFWLSCSVTRDMWRIPFPVAVSGCNSWNTVILSVTVVCMWYFMYYCISETTNHPFTIWSLCHVSNYCIFPEHLQVFFLME